MNSSLDEQAETLLRRYLLREDRKDRTISFVKRDGIKFIVDNQTGETNEIVYQTWTDLSIRQFSELIEKTAMTSNKVYYIDYVEIQQSLRKTGKTVCYYLVYSQVDKRYKDVIIVSL